MQKFDFTNSNKQTESKELKTNEQTNTPSNDVKLTDNTMEKAEGNKKTEQQKVKTEPQKAGNVLVTYIGHGSWIDAEREYWSATENKKANVLSNRTYTKDEYESREDLKFMVGYGEMNAIEV